MNKNRLRETWRDAFRSVGRSPGEGWRSKLIHHGSRVLLLVVVAVLIPFLFPRSPLPDSALLEQGQVAPEDVIAEISFDVPKSPSQLQLERAQAERGVAPVFTYDPEAVQRAGQRVRDLFARMDSALAVSEVDSVAVREVLMGVEEVTVPTVPQTSYLLVGSRRRALLGAILGAYDRLLPRGVVSSRDLSEVLSARVIIRAEDGDQLIRRDSLLDIGGFYREASDLAPSNLSVPGLQLYQTLVIHYLEPSLTLDLDATALARRQARDAVQDQAGFVLQGERIVTAHERVGRDEIDKLRAYRSALIAAGLASGAGGMLRSLGAVLYGLILLGILGGVLFFYRREAVYESARNFAIVTVLVLFVLVIASIVGRANISPALIPIALAALLISALYDGLLSLITVMVIAAIIGGQPAFTGLSVPLLTMVAGAAAASSVQSLKRRADSWILIAVITGAYFVAAFALLLIWSQPIGGMLATVAWGGINATACTVLAIGALLPALEGFTGITSDQTLLELTDLNRPALRRLAKQAPGTYAHSISVANLAEAACAAIGANALLARAGSYYHDIGKSTNAQYFVENQPVGLNPHDRMHPTRSAAVIREHVREGLRLADDARLPPVIKDFIREHHGTQTISYFLNKAKELAPDAEIDPREFEYAGPKPHTRETAIVMLADAVESATRTLPNPTPERIRALIDELVSARLREGQLEQSPLTLHDLERIQSEFAQTLTSFYHHRIDYGTNGRVDQRLAEERAAAASEADERHAASESSSAASGPSAAPSAGARTAAREVVSPERRSDVTTPREADITAHAPRSHDAG